MADAAALKDWTPEERFLYYHHMDNMLRGAPAGAIRQPDGATSTILQRVVEGPGGRFYNIPSVWGGKMLSEQAARKQAAAVGWSKWPSYKTPEQADARYMEMHSVMEQDIPDPKQEPPFPLMPFRGKTLFEPGS